MNLRIEKVSKKFGGLWALEQVSLDLEEGQVVGFVLV
jgi:ABC-type branched-subunit amino acid transport system ATPase component